MPFFSKPVLSAATLALCASTAFALDFVPVGTSPHGNSKRDGASFAPKNQTSLYWQAPLDDSNNYLANFTVAHPADNEQIICGDDFTSNIKSITCGSSINIEFQDAASFSQAVADWQWVNVHQLHQFTLFTAAGQCSQDITPYTVTDIQFTNATLQASLTARNATWQEIAQDWSLKVGPLSTPGNNNTARGLEDQPLHGALAKRIEEQKTIPMSLEHHVDVPLAGWSKDKWGIDLKGDVIIDTHGKLILDVDFEGKLTKGITKANMNLHPQGLNANMMLALTADGKLGNGIDWTPGGGINIPVEALNIPHIGTLGPVITLGVHFGSSALEGTLSTSLGGKASIDDSSKVYVDWKDTKNNQFSGWKPDFSFVAPEASAEIKGNVKAWADLGIKLEAALTIVNIGYQAGIDAQLPYFEADLSVKDSTVGVCNSKKTKGIEVDVNVGIDVNLNAGEVNKAPMVSTDLYKTQWPLTSMCLGYGADDAHTGGTIATAGGKTKTDSASHVSATKTGETHSTGKPASSGAKSTESGKSTASAETGSSAKSTGASQTGSVTSHASSTGTATASESASGSHNSEVSDRSTATVHSRSSAASGSASITSAPSSAHSSASTTGHITTDSFKWNATSIHSASKGASSAGGNYGYGASSVAVSPSSLASQSSGVAHSSGGIYSSIAHSSAAAASSSHEAVATPPAGGPYGAGNSTSVLATASSGIYRPNTLSTIVRVSTSSAAAASYYYS